MKKRFSFITSYLIVIIGIFTLYSCIYSCSEIPKKNNPQEVTPLPKKNLIIKKPGSSFNDTIIINTRAAVFYNPDSLQMEKIKAVNKKAVFDMITHDCHYQMQNARIVLKKYWPKVLIIEVSQARYLLFIKEDKSQICIDLNNKNDICGLYLFDRKKNPVLSDMPNIDTELGFYFKK